MEGIRKTKEVNINTKGFWNKKWSHHGGGERDDPERLKPIARKAIGDSVLDVGCSFGHLCKYLAERCDFVVGVDFSIEAIKRAKKNYPFCMFLVAEATSLPFRGSCFNTVTMVEVLEHLTDFWKGLEEARRVGGKVVFMVPDSSVYDEHVWTFSEEGIKHVIGNYPFAYRYYERLARKWWLGVIDG